MKEAKRELPKFVSFLRHHKMKSITTMMALQWATQPKTENTRYWAQRLTLVRGFAKYLSSIVSRTEIPPPGLLRYGNGRRKPYIYTDDDIRRILEGIIDADSPRRIHAKTYSTLLGLLFVTGMRLSEVLNLNDNDVDLTEGLLTIRESKWRKSRLIPIHPTTQNKLKIYRKQRNHRYPRSDSQSFFILDNGRRPKAIMVERKFLRVTRRIGLRGPPGTKGPRIHDFRHTFAVRTLINWYRSGVDVERRMPELSTYLGHSHVFYTYWYLSAEPELLRLAVMRLEHLERN
jgi:integrase